MCTELIMKALRIEVALYDQNQNLELMSEIAKCMAKFALNPKERFRFDYVEIEELPDVFSPWVMKTSSSSKPQQAVETIEVEEELAREYLIEDLPHAALEVDKTVLKFIEESKARALKQAVQKEKTVSAEDARVSEANRMRRDVLSDQLAAHMIDCPTAPNMAGPALPDPATEILRYQGMAIARTLDSSQTEDIHRLPGDRASGGVTSSASCAFGRPADSMGGSGSVFNGSESSMHTAGRGDRGIAGSFFQADTQTSALKIPNFEMDFSCALGDDLFQNGSLALMGGVDCAEDVPRIMLTNNADSGRIGEGLAFEYLKIKAVELGFLQAPEWMNSLQESGLPYDIEVLTSGGVTKYCEVKTRSFRENGDREKEHCQWFISLNEVLTAARLDSLFFTLCLSMSVNIDTGKVTPHSASFIGLERGLAHALNNKGASLILQDNRTRLTYLPESQPKASTALDK